MRTRTHIHTDTTKHSMTPSSLCVFQAERSHAVKQIEEQDLLLEAARRNIQTELQVALTHKVNLQLELWVSHTQHAILTL